jgi:oligoendopeptidase F
VVSETQKIPRRDEIPAEHTWDLTTVYRDDAHWQEALTALEQQLPALAAHQGQVAVSGGALLATLQARDAVLQHLWQLYVYAERRHDSDTGEAVGQALSQQAGSLVARVLAALSFIEPEILAADEASIVAWQHATPDLAVYGRELAQLMRRRAHVRSAEVEALLAEFGDVARAPSDIVSVLTNADLSFPTMTDEHGQTIEISHGRYGRLLKSGDRRVRRDVFKGYYAGYQGIRNTLGTALAAHVRTQVLGARVRGYGSALEAALSATEIPVDVYHNLIQTVNANLPRLHRYVALRQQIMQLDEVRIYDLYAPLATEAELTVTYEEAQQIALAAFAPLGAEYVAAVEQTFRSRWIDVYENVGKRSGAYSDGSYTTAPFILLNYQDRLDDLFTLAHELGHSMHSYFTRRAQPFVYGDYTIFVAEVASTLNEALLTDYLLRTRDDPALRRHLLVQQLEDIRTTLLRQTMFAEFELAMHQRAEAGEPLTAENLSQPYRELVARYHGPQVVLDDEIALEWARIPHFYYNFYVYQYATGLAAALALSDQILADGEPAVARYLTFLSSGSSQPPIELLRAAGVDMRSPAPVQAALDRFDQLLDRVAEAFGVA